MKLVIFTALLILMAGINASAIEYKGESFSESDIIQGMKDVDAYIHLNEDRTILFDRESALVDHVAKKSFSIGIAYETYQNAVVEKMKGIESNYVQMDPMLKELFAPFYAAVQSSGSVRTSTIPLPLASQIPKKSQEELATNANSNISLLHIRKKQYVDLAEPQVCGGGKDKPHVCPKRFESGVYKSTQTEIGNYVKGLGYHNTYFPGCGIGGYPCTTDFSKNLSAYSCSSGIFRMQANLSTKITSTGVKWTFSTQGSQQYPEPNPEILSYFPPAIWWPGYVNWWHTEWVQPNGHKGC
ncbi:MAG: hypothetical protein AABW68_01050 [archaeon]